MGKIQSIQKDKNEYCEHARCIVNIHILIHPVLKSEYSKVCDNASRCDKKDCKYQPNNCQ